MTKPLLTLETLEPDRPFIEIDGETYELAVPEDFGLIESARFAKLVRQARDAEKSTADMTDQDEAVDAAIDALEQLADSAAAMVLRAPDEVRARLNSSQKLQVVSAFSQATTRRTRTSPPKKTVRQRRSTSGSSSRSSRRPTARSRGSSCRSGN